jgi:hypothetical protein
MGKPMLVDPYGRPVASNFQFFEGADRFRNMDQQNLVAWNGARDTDKVLSTSSWRDAMSSARWVLGNVPLIRGALMEQASYSFPLEPHYRGDKKNKKWAKEAKSWLHDWKQNSDIKGAPFNARTAARIRLLGRKVDGDIGRILTFDENSDYPRLQFVRAHRLGTTDAEAEKCKRGPYRGKKIKNGVIVDDYCRPLAYRILGERGSDGNMEYVDIPASNFLLTFNPEFSDRSRGISEMMVGMASIVDHRRWRENEMRAQQAQSQNALTEDNDEGEAPPGGDYTLKRISGVSTAVLDNGLTRYYRSGSGGKLELVRPDRPGPGCLAFEDRILTALFYGIEWDPFFAIAIKEPGGAWARTIIQKVQRAIALNQWIEAQAQRAEDVWALSRAIYTLKILPPPPDGDIFSWDYSGPAKLTADSGNDESAKREKYRLGILTMEKWASEDGDWWEETRDQKEVELRDKLTRARAVQKDFPELSFQECCNLIEQWTPNSGLNVVQDTAEAPASKEAA